MATLSASNPFFVRCIKPNMEKVGLTHFCTVHITINPSLLSLLSQTDNKTNPPNALISLLKEWFTPK